MSCRIYNRYLLGIIFKNTVEQNPMHQLPYIISGVTSKLLHTTSNCALKSNLPIKWVRPEKIPCFHPQKSGDLKPIEKVDLKQLAPEFRDLEEIKSADENVRKLFTLEYLPYRCTKAYLRDMYLNKVRRHQFDISSPEARIARMTLKIRELQNCVDKYPRDTGKRVKLKELIDKRKRLLKFLRTWDYKCFEYVLEKLDLIYKPFPPADVWKRIERKRSLRMLTKDYCEKIVAGKLEKYREELESQQENFLDDKISILKWIMKAEASCGVNATVTDEDIKAVEEEVQKLREAKKKETVVINE